MEKRLVFFSFFIFTSLIAHAEFTGQKCNPVLIGSGEIQINRQWDAESGVCFIDIHPRNTMNLKYRDYYFDNKGSFLVFNTYGYGPDVETTGAREFFIFPVIEDYPDYSIEENGDVLVKLVSGHLFRISARDFSIQSFSPGAFTEKVLSKTNNGGVEITLSKGYWVDGGFMMGGSRFSQPHMKSTVKSSLSPNSSCSILNTDFLKYSGEGDFDFKYHKEQLTQYFKSKCPKIKF